MASKQLEAPPEILVMANRMVMVKEDPKKRLEIGKLLRKFHFSTNGEMLMAEYFYDPENEKPGKGF